MSSAVVQEPDQATFLGQEVVVEVVQIVDAPSPGTSQYLIASPYVEQGHLLDLDTLDAENQILAKALVELKAVRDDYSTAPYLDSFNWGEVMDRVRELALARNHVFKETAFYLVVFRSQIQRASVSVDLAILDKDAHAEATASGGFLKYWFGIPNNDLRNLATCIWRSKSDAKKGGEGPAHRRAVHAVRSLYSDWKIDQHRLVIRDGVSTWIITKWVD